MIPILYSGSETSFTSNGLGRLTDIIECTCTEERNGIYEVEFTYPVTGKFYQQMVNMVEAHATGNWNNCGVIGCIHDDRHDIQPFDLYSVSSPIDGVATFNAHHISYRLGREIVVPFSATSAADAISQLPLKIKGGSLFTFWTDKATGGSMELKHPENVRNILGGQEGSILDCFGTGEYEFDKFAVKLYQNRGVNTGATIRYGKNMTDITRDIDSSGSYNAVAPYWTGQVTNESTQETRDAIVYLSEVFVKAPDVTGDPIVAALDVSGDFQEIPTQNELKARALQYLNENRPWVPKDNIKVSFVQLWQTEEYKDVAILQRLSICDQINVYYEALGVVAEEQEVIRVVYNVLLERYDEMELGAPETSLASSLSSETMAQFESELEKAKKAAVTSSMLQAAIKHATDLITGGLGGHVVFTLNADGKPEEILIMDTDDPNTAVNVWRFNKNGLGHSHNGYNGPFSDVALTADGAINAALITTGTMLANIIKGGTLSLGGTNNGNGVMRLYDASNNEIVTADINGITTYSAKWYSYYDNPLSSGIDNTHQYWSSYLRQYKEYWIRKTLFNSGGLIFYTRMVAENGNLLGAAYDKLRGYMMAEGRGLSIIAVGTDASPHRQGVKIKGYRAELAVGGNYYSSGESIFDSYNYDNLSDADCAIGLSAPYIVVPRGRLVFQYSSSKQLAYIYDDYQGLNIELSEVRSTSQGNRHKVDFLFDHSGNFSTDGLIVNNTYVSFDKSRVVDTEDYQKRLLYCYETPTPTFGDIGDSVLDETGESYIVFDPIFAETIDVSHQYQVFLQKYGDGDCWVDKRTPQYFLVKGTPGLKFGWEIKAKQFDYNNKRLNKFDKDFIEPVEELSCDYGELAANYIQNLEEERMNIE